MNCPICLNETDDMYTIACGSKTPHQICNTCEITMRGLATPTNHGRFIKCPSCRVFEPVHGARTIESYEAELQRPRTIESYEAELQRMYAQTLINPRIPSVTIIGQRLVVNLGHRILSAVMPHIIPMVQIMSPHQLDLLAQEFALQFALRNPAAPVPVPVPAPVPALPAPVPALPAPAPALPAPAPRIWCQSGRRNTGQCPTKSKTKRICSFDNCLQRVCRTCKQCITH